MRTDIFLKKIKDMGLGYGFGEDCIEIYKPCETLCEPLGVTLNEILAEVYTKKENSLNTSFPAFDNLPFTQKCKLCLLLCEYVSTPLDERKKTQKYYLRFTALTEDSDSNYLNYYMSTDTLGLCSPYQEDEWQTQFTQKEIDDIKKRFGVTLSDFEQIPVEEVED